MFLRLTVTVMVALGIFLAVVAFQGQEKPQTRQMESVVAQDFAYSKKDFEKEFDQSMIAPLSVST